MTTIGDGGERMSNTDYGVEVDPLAIKIKVNWEAEKRRRENIKANRKGQYQCVTITAVR